MRYIFPLCFLACVDGKFNPEEALPEIGEAHLDADGDGFSIADGDCDDDNTTVHPQALEVCDGQDNDCDALIDEEALSWSWKDDKAVWTAGERVSQVNVTIDNAHWDGASAIADGLIDERQHFIFDENGAILEQNIDFGGDGSIEIAVQYQYNAQGWLVQKSWDVSLDGVIDRLVEYGYNALGQPLYVAWDLEGDGIVDEEKRLAYDGDHLIEEIVYRDGVQSSKTQWVYEADNLIYKDVEMEDKTRYFYRESDDAQRIVEVDEGIDGSIDARFTEHYDTQGRLSREARDLDLDANDDMLSRWEFDYYGLFAVHRGDTLDENVESIFISHREDGSFMFEHGIDSYFVSTYTEEIIDFTCMSYVRTATSASTASGQ